MARVLILSGCALALLAASPAEAQQRPRPETAAEAGLRYLSWPGRPAVREAAPPPTRPGRPRPPRVETPRVETPAEQPPATPVVRAEQPAPPPVTSASADAGVRYYSVHRAAGRAPDPIPEAGQRASGETLVALAVPSGPTLADRDRTVMAEEALDILRALPPDQLAQLLEQPR